MLKKLAARLCLSPPPEVVLSEADIDLLTANTGLPRDEVEQLHASFLANHGEGRISRRSFLALLEQNGGGGSGGGHPSPKLGRHMFRMFDTNSDGQVSFVELVLALHVMKRGSAEDNLRRIFRLFDINSDGEISRKELEKIVKHLGDEEEEEAVDNVARTAFDEMDDNGDGRIDQEEFVSACLTRRRKTSTELATKIASIFVAEG